MTPVLELDGLHAHYDKSHILHGVSMKVGRGEIVSLLGRNGSGRSTTLKAIMGLVRPTGGRVRLEGRDVAGKRAYRIACAGIAYVPEEREIFANITVEPRTCASASSPRARGAALDHRADVRLLPAASRSGATPPPACCRVANSRC